MRTTLNISDSIINIFGAGVSFLRVVIPIRYRKIGSTIFSLRFFKIHTHPSFVYKKSKLA